MHSLREIISTIHDSPWKGIISETGLGVPVQDMLTRVAGASATIYYGSMPYDKAFQIKAGRAVSSLMALETARHNWTFLSDRIPQANNTFSLAVTGAHKTADELGGTHAWVSLIRSNGETSLHFSIPKGVSRVDAIDLAGQTIIRYVHASLIAKNMNGFIDWACNANVNVDVVDDPKIDLKSHLELLKPSNPLLYHQGKFQRTASYVRESKKIYRGTFYPPTIAHIEIGKGALFEITALNARKQAISREQLIHSLNMLQTLDIPVLITEVPLFIDFHHLLVENGVVSPTYIIGADTFNAICEWEHCNKSILLPFFEGEASFEIHSRSGVELTTHPSAKKMHYYIADSTNTAHISSTAARNGNFEYLPPSVLAYVKEHYLFQEK